MIDEEKVHAVIDEMLGEGLMEIHPDDRDKPEREQRVQLTEAGRDELARLERKAAGA